MRQMLSEWEQFPIVGTAVLLIFAALFGYIFFETMRKKNRNTFEQASSMPLEDQEQL